MTDSKPSWVHPWMLQLMSLAGLSLAVLVGEWVLRGSWSWPAILWATGLCLAAQILVVRADRWAARQPGMAVAGPLLGTLVRLMVVSAGAVYVLKGRGDVSREPFLICLVLQYLASLALHTQCQLAEVRNALAEARSVSRSISADSSISGAHPLRDADNR